MGSTRRRRLGVRVVVVAFALLLAPSSGTAGSLDACAQRVIRDWYSGGRVDGVYPLACYRAALRALPNDVLQYSNADQDIRRALAFARRGRTDPGSKPLPAATKAASTQAAADPDSATGSKAPAATPRTHSEPSASPTPSPGVNAAAPAAPRTERVVAETTSSARSVPYPIVMLAALSAVLLLAGAARWLANRRR
jgi:predicted secreted protein